MPPTVGRLRTGNEVVPLTVVTHKQFDVLYPTRDS